MATRRTTTTAKASRNGGSRDGLPSSERVYRRLKESILSSELAPGTRLVEVQVARDLGVSRTPVREALKRLLAEGYVSRDVLGGLVVHEASPSEVDEAYPVREVLDGLACWLAAQRITTETLIKLRVIHDTLADAAREGRNEDTVTANIAFHDAIYDIAGNQRLIALGSELRDFVRRFSHEAYANSPERVAEVVQEHERILDALERRDPDDAEAAGRQHLREARAHMTRLRAAAELEAATR